jgi:hypothetical protein
MKFCPQCGASLTPGGAFCEQCGFKIELETPVSPVFQSNDAPQYIPNVPPPQPAAPQYQQSEGATYQPVSQNAGTYTEPKKGKLVPILIVIGAVIILGAGGWLVYSTFIDKAKSEAVVADSSAMVTSDNTMPAIDTAANVVANQATPVQETPPANPVVQEAPTQPVKATIPSQPVKVAATAAKPSSSKVETKPVSKAVTPVTPTVKVSEPVKESKPTPVAETKSEPVVTVKAETKSQTILNIGQLGLAILKNPKKPCVLTLTEKYCITRITTDHYNNGKGTSATGSIGIDGINGGALRNWQARGSSGITGVANSKWIIEPKIILDAGSYTIVDSDNETWSKIIAGKGFVTVEGYKMQ